MFGVLVGGDSRFMAIHGIGGEERRVWRAVLFALAVVAQLVLPAITMRAQALAAELCVVDRGDGGDPSKGHRHQQQCLHCRVHDCAALMPPSVRVAGATRVTAAEPPIAARLAVAPLRRVQPPPTGPPAR